MLILKIAYRTLMRRKGRAALIGSLVAFGTFLIVFGTTFTQSAADASRASIIDNFTGDLIVYSARSKELPSPFAFQTPLPAIRDMGKVQEMLGSIDGIEARVPYSQNYGIVQVERDGKKVDLPLIVYSVEPEAYRSLFRNAVMTGGSFYGLDPAPGAKEAEAASGYDPRSGGVLVSRYQLDQYKQNYGVTLKIGEPVTMLGVTSGGVNTVPSRLIGVFEPEHYKNVFNYINFLDAGTFGRLYNFTGVSGLPESFSAGLDAAAASEDDLFALAEDENFGKLDLSSLKAEPVSGFTMIALKLAPGRSPDAVKAEIEAAGADLDIKVATWQQASGFYATISSALQAFIVVATTLIFLVVALIFMNTLIINVVERTAEIGTMRAIGTDKSFVMGLFVSETLILNITASLIAMAATLALMLGLSRGGIPLPDTISQFLVGGGPVPLTVRFLPFAEALVVVAAVSVLATLYPVRVATSITPLKAMSDK